MNKDKLMAEEIVQLGSETTIGMRIVPLIISDSDDPEKAVIGGYFQDKFEVLADLQAGRIYTVIDVEVEDWSTRVKLAATDKWYNSTCFRQATGKDEALLAQEGHR